MHRRSWPAFAAVPLARPALVQGARPLRFVPIGDLPTIDPIVTATSMVRTHGFLVRERLHGLDHALAAAAAARRTTTVWRPAQP
jgi:hypothetical protein